MARASAGDYRPHDEFGLIPRSPFRDALFMAQRYRESGAPEGLVQSEILRARRQLRERVYDFGNADGPRTI